jgi:FlgD Ig-like domain
VNRRVSLGAALFFCVLVAAVTATVLVIRARTPDLVLEVTYQCPPGSNPDRCRPVFEPGVAGRRSRIEIRFFVRESDGGAFVGIADSHENVVRTLDASAALAAGRQVRYLWDGRTDDGRPAPAGRYRLRVDLPSEDREMIWPRRIFLERLPRVVKQSADAGPGGSS